jgi:hypothetical protein
MVKQKQNLEVGQIVYGANYKTKRISFDKELFVGLKLMKPNIRSISEKFITLEFDKYNTQRISKSKIGKMLFITQDGAIDFIIKELRNRIKELENRKRNMPFDIECLKELKTNLKKWDKIKLNLELLE